jgi:cell wall-associated NlpC family hydrolase
MNVFKRVARMAGVCAVVTAALSLSVFAYEMKGGTVTTSSSVNIRSGAGTSYSKQGSLKDGERVLVLDNSKGWCKIAYDDGKIGYMSADYVDISSTMNIEMGYAQVTVSSSLNMRAKPSTSGSKVTQLPNGAKCDIIGINNGWLKVNYKNYTGYIFPGDSADPYVKIVEGTSSGSTTTTPSTPAPSTPEVKPEPKPEAPKVNPLRQQIVDYAAKFLGVPYVYGGSTPKGFDCSGLVKYVYNNFDISLARTSAKQYSTSVTKITKSELKIGDLVFFSGDTPGRVGHVGIYVGNDQFIHAPRPGKDVCYEKLSNSYYVEHYIGCGTLIKD